MNYIESVVYINVTLTWKDKVAEKKKEIQW